ncbi:hypothetical protein BC941DRAFT_434460 [Chlamydoabsidia padenii]|nr:hypothetical protein BC941DRAFT_434460 [Chlamydoabsidia padenii]
MFTGTLWLAFFLDCCLWWYMMFLCFWYEACLHVLLLGFHVYCLLWCMILSLSLICEVFC